MTTAEKEIVQVITVDKSIVAIVRRDPISKKQIVYRVKEMDQDDIVKLITTKHE